MIKGKRTRQADCHLVKETVSELRLPCPSSVEAQTVEWPREAGSKLVWAHLYYTEESYDDKGK